jgi:lysophospholipase L1-like esterase
MNQKPTFMALGDSYTIGEGVLPAERWPDQLCRKMQFAAPDYIAQTGWTSQELLEAIDQARVAHFYDWVSLLIGVNNQYRGMSLSQYSMEFEIALYKALALSHSQPKKVIVLSVPDYSVTPAAQHRNPAQIFDEINAFNAVNESLARREGTHYVQVTDISRLAADEPDLLAADGLHPSSKMYERWVARIIEAIA